MKSINNLQEGKSEAREMFFEAPKENQYGGILGYVNKRNKTILLWTEKGPKIFKFDDKTLLYVYYICTEENLARYNSSLGFGLHRTMELPDAWYKIARKGTYGGVILDKKGNVTEAHLSDIWSFLPIDLNVSCKGK